MTEAVHPDGAAGAAADDWEAHWGNYASSAEDNPAQAYRRRRVFALLSEAAPVVRLLDIGAGQGDLLRFASAQFPAASLAGVELSEKGVAACRVKVPAAHVVQRNLMADAPVEPDLAGWATHAVCSEVLEHVDDPARLLRNASAYLAPGCTVVVTVPGGPRSAFDKHIGHRRHFTPGRLAETLARAGLADIRVQAAGFPVFNLYKLVVIARGNRLINDARNAAGTTTVPPTTAKIAGAAMAGFDRMFRFALADNRWGWQLLAAARAAS